MSMPAHTVSEIPESMARGGVASRRRHRSADADRGQRARRRAGRQAGTQLLASAGDRSRRLYAVAETSAAEAAEWRQRAWQLLWQARAARADADEDRTSRLLDEIRRLRARAAKAGAFARLCRGRAAQSATADDAGET